MNEEAKPLITIKQDSLTGKFNVTNDTINTMVEAGATDQSNRMFVVVRNLKSANRNVQDYKLGRGDTIKLGRLKFAVKDFRTENQTAIADRAQAEHSPVKQWHGCGDEEEDDFAEEEAVEIDCGVVN